ncbi:small-conductance mechanosensitive channel [Kibdelosporangium banguiense]|uniref:Small-conductance mechanosensitive channel n=1 Tax=Kibdelosporangium banguiense TaxID=1365924 RepID=A0ABS4TT58_9PSEU|nr:hypothetical protein [Kibdelosporangium banguiense]MBP2327189.1 small-conductance mechanosensitive channel [Kibdelosporangium banguiense]
MGSISAGGGRHGVVGRRPLMGWRVLGALLLLAMGGIHLYLVFEWADGLLGVLFVLNAIGGLVLAIAMIAAPVRLLPLASALSLVFMVGTLLALVLALTVGLFGITETMSGQLVSTTLIVEAIGAIVLAATTVLAFRNQRSG